MTPPTSIARVRQINRTWVVRGGLADDTERYLDRLETQHPEVLLEVCERAIAAARKASAEHRDPKPDFYAALFSLATFEERNFYLCNHLWTRTLSARLCEQ